MYSIIDGSETGGRAILAHDLAPERGGNSLSHEDNYTKVTIGLTARGHGHNMAGAYLAYLKTVLIFTHNCDLNTL